MLQPSPNNKTLVLTLTPEIHGLVYDLAEMYAETSTKFSASDIIRFAIEFTYLDNERMRECFKKSRQFALKMRRERQKEMLKKRQENFKKKSAEKMKALRQIKKAES